MTHADRRLAELKIWRETRPTHLRVLAARAKQIQVRLRIWKWMQERKELGLL